MKGLRLVPTIPEGLERIARGREAHPGLPWKRENNPGGVADSRVFAPLPECSNEAEGPSSLRLRASAGNHALALSREDHL